MTARRDGDGRQQSRRPARSGSHQEEQQHNESNLTRSEYSTLTCARALVRAACAYLDEEVVARRQAGDLPTRELCRLVFFAAFLHDRLADLAIREGGNA